jgi:hypothetical protein
MSELARVKASGLPVKEQMGVDCCHANQDKFWVKDPDGVEWEVYHLNYDLESEESEATARPTFAVVGGSGSGCCGGTTSCGS